MQCYNGWPEEKMRKEKNRGRKRTIEKRRKGNCKLFFPFVIIIITDRNVC